MFTGIARGVLHPSEGKREATKMKEEDDQNDDDDDEPYLLRPVVKKSTRIFDQSRSWTGPVKGGYKICCPWCFTPTYVSNATVDQMFETGVFGPISCESSESGGGESGGGRSGGGGSGGGGGGGESGGESGGAQNYCMGQIVVMEDILGDHIETGGFDFVPNEFLKSDGERKREREKKKERREYIFFNLLLLFLLFLFFSFFSCSFSFVSCFLVFLTTKNFLFLFLFLFFFISF